MQSTQDAAFFEMVHGLQGSCEALDGHEQRTSLRYQYPCAQLVAPYDGKTLPTVADFQQVQCQDLSSGGFSFFIPEPPGCSQLVVALGTIPATFLTARVMRVTEADRDEEPGFLVACRFTHRIE